MGNLDNKVAIVTGAGRGIGQAIAVKLAGEGARVVVNDLDEGPAKETVGVIEAAGGAAVREQLEAMTPLGRAGTPEEAAGAVYLLCTPEADCISGQVVRCAGGF